MEFRLSFLEDGEKKIPAYLSINVLEWIQNEYGSFDGWLKALYGDNEDAEEPMLGVVRKSLCRMINEGIDYVNFTDGKAEPHVNEQQTGWIIDRVGFESALSVIKASMTETLNSDAEDEPAGNVESLRKESTSSGSYLSDTHCSDLPSEKSDL